MQISRFIYLQVYYSYRYIKTGLDVFNGERGWLTGYLEKADLGGEVFFFTGFGEELLNRRGLAKLFADNSTVKEDSEISVAEFSERRYVGERVFSWCYA